MQELKRKYEDVLRASNQQKASNHNEPIQIPQQKASNHNEPIQIPQQNIKQL